jgi:hypothetical protein
MWIPLFDLIDAISCLVLMMYLVPVAALVSFRAHLGYAVLVVVLAFVLLVNFLAPFGITSDVAHARWEAAALHTVFAIAITVFRRRLWIYVRMELGTTTLLRRKEDVKAILERRVPR